MFLFVPWKTGTTSPIPCRHLSHSPSLSLLLRTSPYFLFPSPCNGAQAGRGGLAVLLRVMLLSSEGPDSGPVREVSAQDLRSWPLCLGERRQLRMPCKIYECVLLIALVALQEDGMCFGFKQGKSNRGIRRGDRTKAVFMSLLRSGGHHALSALPSLSLTLGLSLHCDCLHAREHQPLPHRLL